MTPEEIRVVLTLGMFVLSFLAFALVCIWATRGSKEIETYFDELDDERSQRRRC